MNNQPYDDSESNINPSNEQQMQQQYYPFYNMDLQQQHYFMNQQQFWTPDQFEQYEQFNTNFQQQSFQGYYQNINSIQQSGESIEKVIESALKNMLFKSSPKKDSQPESQVETKKPSVKKTPKGKKKKHEEKVFKFDDTRTALTDEMRVCPSVTLSKEGLSKLNKQCIKLYKTLIPTQKEIEKKNKFFESLRQALRMKWKGIKILKYLSFYRYRNAHVWK